LFLPEEVSAGGLGGRCLKSAAGPRSPARSIIRPSRPPRARKFLSNDREGRAIADSDDYYGKAKTRREA